MTVVTLIPRASETEQELLAAFDLAPTAPRLRLIREARSDWRSDSSKTRRESIAQLVRTLLDEQEQQQQQQGS